MYITKVDVKRHPEDTMYNPVTVQRGGVAAAPDRRDRVDAEASRFPEPEDVVRDTMERVRRGTAAYAAGSAISAARYVSEEDMAAPGRTTGPDFIVKSVVETGEPARYTAGTALVFLLCFGGSLVVFSGVARDLRRSRAARAVEDAHAFDDNLSSLGHMYDKSYAFATECAGPALLPPPPPLTRTRGSRRCGFAVDAGFDEDTRFEEVWSRS